MGLPPRAYDPFRPGMVLSDPSWDFVQERFGWALHRISRRRRPLHISPLTAVSLHELWRISCARKMGEVRANTPNADRTDSLIASRRAAWGHGTLELGRAVRLEQLSHPGRTQTGFTSELDA